MTDGSLQELFEWCERLSEEIDELRSEIIELAMTRDDRRALSHMGRAPHPAPYHLIIDGGRRADHLRRVRPRGDRYYAKF